MAHVSARERPVDRGRRLGRRIRRELGEQIRTARITAGLSQSVLGAAVEMSHTKVGRIESGDYPAISLDELCAVFAVLGCDLSVRAYPSRPRCVTAGTSSCSSAYTSLSIPPSVGERRSRSRTRVT